MSVNIFQSSIWFSHLWSHGFENVPHRYWILPLNYGGDLEKSCVHLIQQNSVIGLTGLSNYYSCLFGPEQEELEFTHFCKQDWVSAIEALRGIPGSEMVRLNPLDSSSIWLPSIKNAFRSKGFWTRDFFCFGNWYQIVPVEGFKAYWDSRPSALRNSVKRGRRRLDAMGDWRIDIHAPVVNSFSNEIENVISGYEEVYAKSWKKSEPCKEFIPGLIRISAQKGWLRLGLLWLDGLPVAVQLWLVADGKANIYKLAYVKGVERLSVGSVLTAEMMKYAMNVDKVNEIDYLSGDDAYKADWMELRRERIGILAVDLRKLKGWKIIFQYLTKKFTKAIYLCFSKTALYK